MRSAVVQLAAATVFSIDFANTHRALNTAPQADPEAFQFGNHWPGFLELASRALDSKDPAVHAKVSSRSAIVTSLFKVVG